MFLDLIVVIVMFVNLKKTRMMNVFWIVMVIILTTLK
jgi:hypothetical protein